MELRSFVFLLFGLLLLVGCQATNADSEQASHGVTDFADRSIQFAQIPERIAVLGNGELDIMYALEKEVVARPTSHGKPVVLEADEAEQIGSYHEVDIERLTLTQPDVVFANDPMNQKDISSIEGTGAEVVLTRANSINDIKAQITLIGEVVQQEERAEQIVRAIETTEKEMLDEPLHTDTKALLIYGAPGSNLVALPNSLAGDLLEAAGGINIAAEFEQLQDYPQYAALSPERVIQANPAIVFFMAHGDPSSVEKSFIQEMEQHAGWSQLPAVQEGRMKVLPADLFGTNPGTRVTEAIQYMREQLTEAYSE
ncbi:MULTISPECIES: ABC transporter substrate-binding protein [Shouchella]|uniref:ABC transporter substrate-binding protein n=2 Tax=Shouchella TaxID=2893057 RepID=A0ABY7WDM1_9BACI|nr:MULTISPECIES: ABC transporter substrate-binding protein [Shouchella]MED4126539.1 ABC transporter substrate-binding protein [Shouchella miscanthi]WDF04755.1 ABC transporter substrate-binding protein [Shouchella hunanensis]